MNNSSNYPPYAEEYEDLIVFIKQQPWASLINWNIVNTGMHNLWIYDHHSEMRDGEAIVIQPFKEGMYFIIDNKLKQYGIGNTQEILNKLHDYLNKRENAVI